MLRICEWSARLPLWARFSVVHCIGTVNRSIETTPEFRPVHSEWNRNGLLVSCGPQTSPAGTHRLVRLKTSPLQNLIERYPVHAGRFHRNRRHSTFLQPVSELMEVTRKFSEAADRIRRPICGDRDEDLFRSNIDPRRVRMEQRRHPAARLTPLHRLSSHARLPSAGTCGLRLRDEQTPERDRRREADVTTELYVTSDPCSSTGFLRAPM